MIQKFIIEIDSPNPGRRVFNDLASLLSIYTGDSLPFFMSKIQFAAQEKAEAAKLVGVDAVVNPQHGQLAIALMNRISSRHNDISIHSCGCVDDAVIEWRSATGKR